MHNNLLPQHAMYALSFLTEIYGCEKMNLSRHRVAKGGYSNRRTRRRARCLEKEMVFSFYFHIKLQNLFIFKYLVIFKFQTAFMKKQWIRNISFFSIIFVTYSYSSQYVPTCETITMIWKFQFSFFFIYQFYCHTVQQIKSYRQWDTAYNLYIVHIAVN